MRHILPILLLVPFFLNAQTTFFNGDTSDVTTPTYGGVVLMGGGTEVDEAMKWFLERSGGGDVVVLRASGSSGYQTYLYSELGVPVNSVQTIVTTTFAEAQNPYVAQQIRRAEALWIAGGDQGDYVNFWRNTPVEDAIRYLIHVKKAPVGGTSAGMAILSGAYFTALNGTITSGEALADPWGSLVWLGYNDFLDAPFLEDVITDTHFDNRDRAGRLTAFLGRLVVQQEFRAKGIACNEHTAVCIDSTGLARAFGGHPAPDEFVYFAQTNCVTPFGPELCVPNQPLTWKRSNAAVKTYKVPATPDGNNTFSLVDWSTGTGGAWQNWWVNAGGFFNIGNNATPPDCLTSTQTPVAATLLAKIAPNPTGESVTLTLPEQVLPATVEAFDAQGIRRLSQTLTSDTTTLSLHDCPPGVVFLLVKNAHAATVLKAVKQQ